MPSAGLSWSEPPLAGPDVDAQDWERGRIQPPDPPDLDDELHLAGDLVAQSVCSPQCLVSHDGGHGRDCACACAGRYHGLLATVDIRERLAARRRG